MMDGQHTYLTVLLFVSEEKQFPQVRAYDFRWAKKKFPSNMSMHFSNAHCFECLTCLGTVKLLVI